MAVDALSEQYGTLFVIAAGNAGPETISTPGAAASALTVGAVDKQDNLAGFSSTGPLTGTGALKPDIAAPGVDITAARSQDMTDGGDRAVPHDQRHLDGHPARLRRGGDPRPAAPRLDRSAAQGAADEQRPGAGRTGTRPSRSAPAASTWRPR